MRIDNRQIISRKKRDSNYNYLNVGRVCLILVIFIIFFLILSQNVSAIGITPGRTTWNFEPGMSQEVSFSVVNTEHKDMGVVFTVQGDLAEYITLHQTYSEFSKDEDIKSFAYSVNLPQKFDKPGLYEGEITVLQMPKGIKEQGTFVGATVGVITQLHVYVPYPDKYLDAEVNVVEAGDKTIFLVPIINRGKLDIVKAKAQIDIYSGNDEKVVTLETNVQSILSLERKELVAEWKRFVNPGRYKAIITVRYDNEVTTILKEFNVGEMFLEILEINVHDFQLGEIAKFEALAENKWTSDLRDVYLNILVYNNEGETMADFKSPTYDISSLSKIEMVAYWDTGGVHIGTYDGKLMLRYGEKSTERNIAMKISDDNLEIIGLTGKVIVRGGGGLNMQNILIIVVVVLVVMNIVWFVLIKRFMKRKRK